MRLKSQDRVMTKETCSKGKSQEHILKKTNTYMRS